MRGSGVVVTAADKPLSEQVVMRIAAMVVAAPIPCCGLGFVLLWLLQHRQAALTARYAPMHLAPWPDAVGIDYAAGSAEPSARVPACYRGAADVVSPSGR